MTETEPRESLLPQVRTVGVLAPFRWRRSCRSTMQNSCSPTSWSAASSLLTFATSVVSIPMMLDRPEDGVVAVLTSVKAFGDNLPAMLLWGASIIVLVAIGFALAFVGLVVAVPLIGHATWHAYRDLIVDSRTAGEDARLSGTA